MDKKVENALVQLNGTKYAERQIYQANPLIEACKEMDLLQGRLYYLALMALTPQLTESDKETKKEFEKITFATTDVIKLFGGYGGYHKNLMKKTKQLRDRGLTIFTGMGADGKPKFKQIGIFHSFEWDPDKGGLIIRFTDDVRPYIFDLSNGGYTKIAGRTMFALQSVYATRLVELLLKNQGFPEYKKSGIIKRNITVEKLRFYLNIPDEKYKRMGNFRKVVLDAPIEDINKHTSYTMSYNPVKRAQMIVSFDFTLDIRQGDEQQPQSISEVVEIKQESKHVDVDLSATVDNLEADIFAVLRRYGVGKTVAGRLVKEYPEERIRANINYSLTQKKVRNYGGYIPKAIREDYAAERAAFMQLPLFSQSAGSEHKGDGRKLTETEQRAADKMNAFWYGDKPKASTAPQNEPEPEEAPVAVKPSPAPEPVQTATEDKNKLSVSIETIKMFVDKGKADAAKKELAKLAKKGISIDAVRALSVDELKARYEAAEAAESAPAQDPEKLENIPDQEPPATPEQNIFDEVKVTPEHESGVTEQERILAQVMQEIRVKVEQLSKKEMQIIKDSVEKDKPTGRVLEMRLQQLDLDRYDAYLVVDEYLAK